MKKLFMVLPLVLLLCFTFGCQQGEEVAEEAKAEQEEPEINEQKSKQKYSMKDIVTIATALADYITDHGVAPEQEGTYDENVEFQKALSPFYVSNLPINDGWFNAFRVYCGEACNGKYGISGCGPNDFVVVSYGRDGEKEDWLYDSNNPEAGLYEVVTLDDFDKDIVMWNGSWIRAPSFVSKVE